MSTAIARRVGLFGSIAIGIVILGSGLMGRRRFESSTCWTAAIRIHSTRCSATGICLFDHQGVNVDSFLKVLGNSGQIGAWHFSPRQVQLKEGQAVQAHNSGGELHTFTEVDEFGGGFIQDLNELTGNPVPAPECLDIPDLEFIPPGGANTPDVEEVGEHKYMCCIHPWMRTTVTVR